MSNFSYPSPRQQQSPRMETPPSPRTPGSAGGHRLDTIMENNNDGPSQAASKSRWSTISGKSAATKKSIPPRLSAEAMPPPYARFAFQAEGAHGVEHEKSNASKRMATRRGGWVRLLLIILIVVLVLAVALGVGLGVGLRNRKKSSQSSSSDPAQNPITPAVFPIGQYTLNTALANVSTSCTSNAATWSCWPYTTYSASDPSLSEATFNWILSNTSSEYPTNASMLTTDSSGVAANITITPADDPFAITFTNQSLVYINNDTQPRYTFSFTQSKSVVPSSAITSDGSQSTCFFNSTIFSATLYLSSSPAQDYSENSTSSSSFASWPFAVEIKQTSPGGTGTPDCYETVNGNIGSAITSITTEPEANTCVCDYKNFDLQF